MGQSSDLHLKGHPMFQIGNPKLLDRASLLAVASKQLLFALRFSAGSEYKLIQHVTEPLVEIERLSAAKLFLAGRDFPWHCTALVGNYTGLEDDQEMVFEAQILSRGIYGSRRSMRGTQQVLNNLILDPGGNCLLTNDDASGDLTMFRLESLAQIKPDKLFKFSVPSWAHCTAFRTEQFIPEKSGDFVSMFEQLVADLSSEPLAPLSVADVWVGNCAEFLGLA